MSIHGLYFSSSSTSSLVEGLDLDLDFVFDFVAGFGCVLSASDSEVGISSTMGTVDDFFSSSFLPLRWRTSAILGGQGKVFLRYLALYNI